MPHQQSLPSALTSRSSARRLDPPGPALTPVQAAARGFFVLVGFIGSTGHGCDGKREPRDLGVVHLRK